MTSRDAPTVLVIGATSAIARATARIWAERGARLHLVARDAARLDVTAQDLRTRGAAEVTVGVADFAEPQACSTLVDDMLPGPERVDVILIAYGVLPGQAECETSIDALRASLEVNATSVLCLLMAGAARLEAQRGGSLVAIGSVAGDRGRQSNYVYGAAKGCVELFLQGLRNRLHPAGVHVLCVKPGFVDTPMTAAFDKGPLWSTPEKVAADILKAIDRRRDVLYTPGFWRAIMLVIRTLPEPLFKRLKL